jgi:hypothetical protein
VAGIFVLQEKSAKTICRDWKHYRFFNINIILGERSYIAKTAVESADFN